jgi:N-acetylglucosamine kinase-like BadF-type ATPase
MIGFLGVDIGSSKSHALICDAGGRVLGVGQAGPGNHESVGVEGFRHALHTAVSRALATAELKPGAIAGAGFGIAGYDWDEDTPMIQAQIGALGLAGPFEAVNDAGLGMLAGARAGWGLSIAAGTGVNGRGRGPDGQQARMTGNGTSFAETGGASELVFHAIGEIARAWTMRGPQTALTAAFVRVAGAKDAEDLLAGLARGRYHLPASAALRVFEAADAGDAVAARAIVWLGEGLGDLACGLIRQLDIAALSFDVVLSGSIFRGGPRVIEAMRGVVHRLAPRAEFTHLNAPPVSGAVLLAMQRAGVDFLPLRDTVIAGARLALGRSPAEDYGAESSG